MRGRIHVTGNSGIDALHAILRALDADPALARRCDAALPHATGRSAILVTLHRRENVGRGAAGLCEALKAIDTAGTADILFPLHPNPALRRTIRAALGGCARIRLLEPLCFVSMVRLMQRSQLILTDSGGLQEEAPSLGKPVLVMRDVTERPEGVTAGLATLTGTNPAAILAGVERALAGRRTRPPVNPYGDGRAAERIVAALRGEPYTAFGDAAPLVVPTVMAG